MKTEILPLEHKLARFLESLDSTEEFFINDNIMLDEDQKKDRRHLLNLIRISFEIWFPEIETQSAKNGKY